MPRSSPVKYIQFLKILNSLNVSNILNLYKKNCIHCAFKTGINFSGIDMCHTKHYIFRVGKLLLLVTRDGDNKLLLLAWCYCLAETGANYKWFAQNCRAAGHGVYLDRAEQLGYADRHKGIPFFMELFTCGWAYCIFHILQNCRLHLKRTGGGAASLAFANAQVSEHYFKYFKYFKYFECLNIPNNVHNNIRCTRYKEPRRGWNTSADWQCYAKLPVARLCTWTS